jgi:hypothetical protein
VSLSEPSDLTRVRVTEFKPEFVDNIPFEIAPATPFVGPKPSRRARQDRSWDARQPGDRIAAALWSR